VQGIGEGDLSVDDRRVFGEAEAAARARLAQAVRAEIDTLPAESGLRHRLVALSEAFDAFLDAIEPYEISRFTTFGEEAAAVNQIGITLGHGPEGADRAEETPPSLALRRVLMGGAEVKDGARLVSVELWEDRVEVNLLELRPLSPAPGSPRWRTQMKNMRDESPTLVDDVGTRYGSAGWGSSGANDVWRIHATFTPAVPEGASRLEVSFGGRVFSVAL